MMMLLFKYVPFGAAMSAEPPQKDLNAICVFWAICGFVVSPIIGKSNLNMGGKEHKGRKLSHQVCVGWCLPKTPFFSRRRYNSLWAPLIHRQMETLVSFPPFLSLSSQAKSFILPQGTYVQLLWESAISRIRANFEIWHISQGAFYCTAGPCVLMDKLEFNAHVTQGTLWSLHWCQTSN